MTERTTIARSATASLDSLAYKMVRLCSIFGYVPDDPYEFQRVLSGAPSDTDPEHVIRQALELFNAHATEGHRYVFDGEAVHLYFGAES